MSGRPRRSIGARMMRLWQTIVNHPRPLISSGILDRAAKLEAEGHTLV